MDIANKQKKLLFENEVLLARLAIRDFHANELAKSIYENVGQVLSVVRMQLGQAAFEHVKLSNGELVQTGELVAKMIHDLRSLSKHFSPDAQLEQADHITSSLEYILVATNQNPVVKRNSTSEGEVAGGIKLITFKLLQDLFTLIKDTPVKCIQLDENYKGKNLEVVITLNGPTVELHHAASDVKNVLFNSELLDLLNAVPEIQEEGPDLIKIFLYIPKHVPYEYDPESSTGR